MDEENFFCWLFCTVFGDKGYNGLPLVNAGKIFSDKKENWDGFFKRKMKDIMYLKMIII